MKKSVKKFLLIALGALGAAANQTALADQATCGTTPCSAGPLSVNFSIIIPPVLRFQIGETAATSPNVQWTAGNITSANIGTGPVNADTVSNGGVGGPTLVDYALMSNLSSNDATITASAVGTLNGLTPGNTIPNTDITAQSNSTNAWAAVPMPVAGTTTTVTPSSGVINAAGTWQYQFANSAIYPADTYTGTITYTVSQN